MNTTLNNPLVVQDFDYARRKAFWRDPYSRLTRRCNRLITFDQIRQSLPVYGQRYLGLQAVLIDKIVGTEGRQLDFDRAFFPRQRRTRDRWVRIAQAYYEQLPLPPVELLKMGEMYVVRDGNHRISVARAQGQNFVDAMVTEFDVSTIPVEPPEKS